MLASPLFSRAWFASSLFTNYINFYIMQDFTYAHNDTSKGERKTLTAQFNSPKIPLEIQNMREGAFVRGIPTADDETLNFLITLLSSAPRTHILELGTAIGISGAVMLNICKSAHLTTVERDETFFKEAQVNFEKLNLSDRVTAICGDAGEVINNLDGSFDFIFLDCAKVQYVKYLPRLKQLLKKGGILLADDVLLYGWLTGEAPIPQKRKMLAQHVKEYIDALTSDKELSTTILNVGDGLAMSVKL